MMKQMLRGYANLLSPLILTMADEYYYETINLPRKQKKRRRKELNLDWQIANWKSEPEYDFGDIFKKLWGI
jgi:hypothetical protein